MVGRLLLYSALIGAMWCIIWLMRYEKGLVTIEKDWSPFAMRRAADLVLAKLKGRDRNR
jgi:hypothetical protein